MEHIKNIFHQGTLKKKLSESHSKSEWIWRRQRSRTRPAGTSKWCPYQHGRYSGRRQGRHKNTIADNLKSNDNHHQSDGTTEDKGYRNQETERRKNTGQQYPRNRRETETRQTYLWQEGLLIDPWIPSDLPTHQKNLHEWKIKQDHKEEATRSNKMGGSQVKKAQMTGMVGDRITRNMFKCKYKNNYNTNSNLFMPPTISKG